jgi:pimeloyl-ACP methyl ester carboxylesterase
MRFSPVKGRYVTVDVQGAECKVFFLDSGEGPALVCQHAGGLHNHQWRHVLENEELARSHRIVAFDAPRHGKSDPPANLQWWKQEYRLTADFYIELVLTLCDALELERPVFLGQGSSGNLALQLALRHPERFGGVIALEAAEHTPGFHLDWWQHPLANAAEVCATGVWDQMAPQSPDQDRWATWFYYTQGVEAFRGDLYFYSVEHDLRGQLDRIDTARCPVVMMTAEYDYVTTPEVSRRTAEQIPGAAFVEMRGIGHFVASENYPVFKPYLLRALEHIEEHRT